VTAPLATVLVRTKDEAAALPRTLELLNAQTLAPRTEIVVVDSGSSDGTVAIARSGGARVVEMPAAEFTYGRSLNMGCAAASGEFVVALSAHAYPRDPEWLARTVDHLHDGRVACVCGYQGDANGEWMDHPIAQDLDHARRYPLWGFSNVNGGWRIERWRERPFREDMPGCEDKEWAWRWLEQGLVVVVDPHLTVDHDHSDEGVRARFDRNRREWLGMAMFLELGPYGLHDVVREWWTDRAARSSRLRALVSPKRLTELAGTYAGRRAGERWARRTGARRVELAPTARLQMVRARWIEGSAEAGLR